MTMKNQDQAKTGDLIGAVVSKNDAMQDTTEFHGQFDVTCTAPVEEHRAEYVWLRDTIAHLSSNWLTKAFHWREIKDCAAKLAAIPTYEKWSDSFTNLITTAGKNNMLDNQFAGSAYTATWYMGLIDNASFTAVAAGDTMASHAGWLESVAYSQSTRVTAAWSAASAGVKALSAALTFSINATVTLNGGFLNSISTKSGTTGVLSNAGSFTGGTRACINGDTVNVSYSATLT